MTDDERDREYSQRLERGLPFIDSDLPQFRPRDGENFIRIVPPLEDDEHAGAWGVDIICHYIDGYGWILSPKSLDQTVHDAVDDLIRELRKIDPDLEEMVRTSRKTVMHILDFNQDERDGVLKLWGAPPTLVDDFVKAAKDKRSGRTHSLEDPENGFPLSFDKSGTGLSTRYSAVQLERDPFPIDEDIAEDLEYFEDVLVIEDEKELNRIIEKILDGARAGGRRGRGRRRGGRDDDERDERDEEDSPPARRGRSRRDRDDDEDEDRGRRRSRGRGRDREDDEDEDRGRGRRRRGRDDEDEGVDAVRERVRGKLDEDGGRGGFRRRDRDENEEEPESEEENGEEEEEAPPPRSRRGGKKKTASKKKTGRSSSRRSSRK